MTIIATMTAMATRTPTIVPTLLADEKNGKTKYSVINTHRRAFKVR